jgi:phosphodiesterase/alkaline phosphatase D-like protein
MPRRAVLASAAAIAGGLAAAVAVAAPSPPGFAYGVAAGEMTPTSVKLWTRAPNEGPVTLVVTGAGATRRFALNALRGDDLTVQQTASGLRPGTTYRYRFAQAGVTSLAGRFETAPAATSTGAVRFAISGDADATPGPNGKPGFNGFETYGAMARAANDFDVNFGDTIYSDSEIGGSPVARTVPQKWVKYRLGLALEPLRRLRASTGVYSGWDDHEFVNDYSRAEHGAAIYRAGVRAFLDYTPASYSARTGDYRTFR